MKLEFEIREQYTNNQILIACLMAMILVIIFLYFVSSISVIVILYASSISLVIIFLIYIVFTYTDKSGKNVIILNENEILWGRYLKDGKFVRVFGPIGFSSIYKIKVKDRYVEIDYIYPRNNLKTDIRIDLKALFMDENERRKRQKILEELLKRVKKVNPDVEIIDMRRREKKVK